MPSPVPSQRFQPYLLSEKQFFTSTDPLPLECGQTLSQFTLAYETFGQPNQDHSNAILILHALSGDSHVAGYYIAEEVELGQKPGWWDNMVGPGKAFDTNQYWIICANVLGGCKGSTGPNSINPNTGKPYATDFPMVTIGDMVVAQKRLIDHLGIQKLFAVTGGSLGGFQSLEWTLRYPEAVKTAICIASGVNLSAQGIAFNTVGRQAILQDPDWHQGHYYQENQSIKGLAIARMLAHITYLSEATFDRKFGRRLQNKTNDFNYHFDAEFAVESYLQHKGQQFIDRFDPNSYLYITKAMDYFDVAQQYGGDATSETEALDHAFDRIQAKFLVLSYTSDWLFPTAESNKLTQALERNHKVVEHLDIKSTYGHDAFLLETDQMTTAIHRFFDQVKSQV